MKPMRPLISVSLALALAACAGGPPPDIATPAPDLPATFLYAGEADTAGAVDSLLPEQDPAFAVLSEAAIADAPSLAEAIARVEAARAGARGAGAARLPNIAADANVTGTRINPAQFGEGASSFIETEQVSYGANLTATWDADLFGRLKSQERAAIARIDSASASAAAVRNSLIAEIAGSVIDWRVLAARTDALTADTKAAMRLADLARTREEAGIAPGFDRIRAEAAASASRSALAALNSERARIIGRLITLTGQTGGEVAAALASDAAAFDLGPVPGTLPSDLLANRPDVLAAMAELAATDADLAASARARFPSLNLSAIVGLLAFSPGDLFDEDSIVGTLAAGLAGPLLDFGRLDAEIDGAAANKKAAFAVYRGAVFQALGDAEAAYGLIAAADNEAALAEKERAELDRAASIANSRYTAGLASFLEVLEARRAADASGDRAAAAAGRAERARVLLWQALGGTPPRIEPNEG
ncbi:efflux transporter outer membrane subunit [Erythrobacter sp. MTPC3]|uniref:efflux transporter outer membrane subunit n=1 Tax=Erythrobacter sp. MTPC3 TaxID=3056564 RepID=UPI0036F3E681